MYHSNANLTLDKRRRKKDGTFPVILRLSHYGKTIAIKVGLSLPEEAWNEKTSQIRKSYRGIDNITRANNLLLKEKVKAVTIITDLRDKNQLSGLSITELKDKIVRPKSKSTFFKFTEQVIRDLQRSNRIGTANSYRAILSVVKKFRDGIDLTFDELNLGFLKQFEIYHLSKGNSLNGLAVYMKSIRAIYNMAIKQGYADKESYPFENYSIRMTRTRKRAISIESIRKIEQLEIPRSERLSLYKDIFLMSFYMMGTAFADLAHLKLSNIRDGRISFIRQRTKRPYDIKINEPLAAILREYVSGKVKDDYLLPIIKRESPEMRHKDITWARQRYNKGLKRLAEKAGIEENLTSYVARHTFASTADSLEVPVTVISQMLGHEKLTTTQVYLAGIRKNVIDEYNEKVVNA